MKHEDGERERENAEDWLTSWVVVLGLRVLGEISLDKPLPWANKHLNDEKDLAVQLHGI